jgi:hypothetical protein
MRTCIRDRSGISAHPSAPRPHGVVGAGLVERDGTAGAVVWTRTLTWPASPLVGVWVVARPPRVKAAWVVLPTTAAGKVTGVALRDGSGLATATDDGKETLVVESTMSETPSTNTAIAMKKAAVASASGRLIPRSSAPTARSSLIARIIPQKSASGGPGSPTRALPLRPSRRRGRGCTRRTRCGSGPRPRRTRQSYRWSGALTRGMLAQASATGCSLEPTALAPAGRARRPASPQARAPRRAGRLGAEPISLATNERLQACKSRGVGDDSRAPRTGRGRRRVLGCHAHRSGRLVPGLRLPRHTLPSLRAMVALGG